MVACWCCGLVVRAVRIIFKPQRTLRAQRVYYLISSSWPSWLSYFFSFPWCSALLPRMVKLDQESANSNQLFRVSLNGDLNINARHYRTWSGNPDGLEYPAIALDYPVKLGNDGVIAVVMTLLKHSGLIPNSSAVLRATPCKLLLKNNELRFVSWEAQRSLRLKKLNFIISVASMFSVVSGF